MSVIRQQQWYGQQRADAPHLRAMESGVAGDFDVLAGRIIGGSNPLIVKGFEVVTNNAFGAPATSLQINTAGGLLIHYLASESGSILSVPANRNIEVLSSSNTRIRGSFTANATNYLGLDLRRASDSSTSDIVQFINTATAAEIAQRVALARTLDYVFVISTTEFSSLSGVCPIAKIVTDIRNNVSDIFDARNMFGRLGSGGTIPNAQHAYAWPGGRLTEQYYDFTYGDRSIDSLKTWMDAAMTRIWELGGGSRWYSPTADRNVVMMRGGTAFSNGEWFEWDGTNLHWRGLRFVWDNSGVDHNLVADQTIDATGVYGTTATNLADGDCIYVDVDRTQVVTLNAIKAAMTTLGTPSVPGSRYIIAWRSGTNIYTRNSSFPVGSTFTAASTTALGIVKLAVTSGTPAAPVVFNPDTNNALTVTASGGNASGVTATGNGTGKGGNFTGGASNGTGVVGTGGVTNGKGGDFTGTGTGTGVKGTGGATNGVGVQGQGTGAGSGGEFVGGNSDGRGVVGQGTGAGAGGDFVGGDTGPAISATAASDVNEQALIRYQDFNGNIRSIVDHNGYQGMGDAYQYNTFWNVPFSFTNDTSSTPTAIAGFYTWEYYTLSSNVLVSTGTVSSFKSFGSAAIISVAGGTGTAEANLREIMPQICTHADASIVWECWVRGTHDPDSSVFPVLGLVATPSLGTIAESSNNDAKVAFCIISGNWEAQICRTSGHGEQASTGIAYAKNTDYKLRIEYHGSNSVYGKCVKFYVNGALTNTLTTSDHIPADATDMYQFLGVGRGSGTLTFNMLISPLRLTYNTQLVSYEA